MSQSSSEITTVTPSVEPVATTITTATSTTTTAASSSTSTLSEPLHQSPPSEEKIEKIKIILDNPQHTYSSGQTIRGTISLNCTQKTQIRGIYFRVIGYGKCNWTDFLRRDSIPVETTTKNERSDIKFWGDEEYINATVYVIGSKNGQSFSLLKGTTTYSFSFSLSPNLPSSFTGDSGKIKYKMEFVIDKPWKFNEKHTIALNVIQTMDLNSVPDAMKPFEQQLTKSIGFIDSGPISLYVLIPKTGYIIDEIIPVQATVANHSKVRVEKIKFALYKVIEYHSISPSLAIKRVMERVIKKVVDGVDKKTEQKFEQSIDVPVTMPTQDVKTSKLIHIKYELKVEIKLGTLYKNMILTAPIVIGNVPFFIKEPDQSVRRTSVAPQASPLSHDANSRSSVFSNWSLELYPQINGDRSSVRTSVLYPAISPAAVIASPTNVVMPMSHPPYPVLPMPSMSPTIPPPSIMNANSPQDRPLSMMNFPPSAPPIDFNNVNASTPLRPQSLFINRPPSYDEVFGFSQQFSQLNMSNSTSWNQNASTKS